METELVQAADTVARLNLLDSSIIYFYYCIQPNFYMLDEKRVLSLKSTSCVNLFQVWLYCLFNFCVWPNTLFLCTKTKSFLMPKKFWKKSHMFDGKRLYSLQLDDRFSLDCYQRKISYSKLLDGDHTLEVCANKLHGSGCNTYHWTVGKETIITPLLILFLKFSCLALIKVVCLVRLLYESSYLTQNTHFLVSKTINGSLNLSDFRFLFPYCVCRYSFTYSLCDCINAIYKCTKRVC